AGSNNLRLPGASTLAGEEHLPVASAHADLRFSSRFVSFSFQGTINLFIARRITSSKATIIMYHLFVFLSTLFFCFFCRIEAALLI
ncbi:hypothetical protein, partial [Geobacillus stearothermophilus]|uniref:hypothetical protein n=1 Tax=Geobacillus stearothermophilus TaxID=1422 RepID=UPI002E1A27F0|nr:hypothetical protein [Geobacillus stearothermophilus]